MFWRFCFCFGATGFEKSLLFQIIFGLCAKLDNLGYNEPREFVITFLFPAKASGKPDQNQIKTRSDLLCHPRMYSKVFTCQSIWSQWEMLAFISCIAYPALHLSLPIMTFLLTMEVHFRFHFRIAHACVPRNDVRRVFITINHDKKAIITRGVSWL